MHTLPHVTIAVLAALIWLCQPLSVFAAEAHSATAAPPAIYGGVEAEEGDWPWMVAVVRANKSSVYSGQYCGGTLVHAQWVLTAAHCAHKDGEELTPDQVHVSVGAHELTANDGERLAVTRIVLHPDFSMRTGHADVALLQLERNVSHPTLRLATADDVLLEAAGTMGTVLGWGLQDGGQYTNTLRQLSVPLIGEEECHTEYSTYTITDGMLCAGYEEDGMGTCSGDSGGPLSVWSDEHEAWVQVGVVSWADGCAQASRYTVYARLTQMSGWIDEQIETLTRIEEEESVETGTDEEIPEEPAGQTEGEEVEGQEEIPSEDEVIQAVPPVAAPSRSVYLPLIWQ